MGAVAIVLQQDTKPLFKYMIIMWLVIAGSRWVLLLMVLKNAVLKVKQVLELHCPKMAIRSCIRLASQNLCSHTDSTKGKAYGRDWVRHWKLTGPVLLALPLLTTEIG